MEARFLRYIHVGLLVLIINCIISDIYLPWMMHPVCFDVIWILFSTLVQAKVVVSCIIVSVLHSHRLLLRYFWKVNYCVDS